MSLFRGQIMAIAAFCFGALSAALLYLYFAAFKRLGDWASLMTFGAACLCFIAAMLLAAWSYMYWVPKWERDEKRTGRVPGEKKK